MTLYKIAFEQRTKVLCTCCDPTADHHRWSPAETSWTYPDYEGAAHDLRKQEERHEPHMEFRNFKIMKCAEVWVEANSWEES